MLILHVTSRCGPPSHLNNLHIYLTYVLKNHITLLHIHYHHHYDLYHLSDKLVVGCQRGIEA